MLAKLRKSDIWNPCPLYSMLRMNLRLESRTRLSQITTLS